MSRSSMVVRKKRKTKVYTYNGKVLTPKQAGALLLIRKIPNVRLQLENLVNFELMLLTPEEYREYFEAYKF